MLGNFGVLPYQSIGKMIQNNEESIRIINNYIINCAEGGIILYSNTYVAFNILKFNKNGIKIEFESG